MKMKSVILRKLCGLTLTGALVFNGSSGMAQNTMKQTATRKGTNDSAGKTTTQKLSAGQKAFHLLNRITFGPRPGDVERVMKTGWEKFLDEQLHPERISDPLAEQKLQALPSISMSAEKLASTYPPGQVINQALLARGINAKALKGEIREMKAQKNAAQVNDLKKDPADRMEPSADQQPKTADQNNQAALNPEDLAKRRQEIRELMQEMGWRPQQEALSEAQQAESCALFTVSASCRKS